MRITMFTNIGQPPYGGVTRSITLLAKRCMEQGNEVQIITPNFHGDDPEGLHIVRMPAVTEVMQSPFSLPLPAPALIDKALQQFKPDIIHSHNPFFLGATAVRSAAKIHVPIVYTHHTRFEEYCHHFGVTTPALKESVKNLAERYGMLCESVIAPSESIARELTKSFPLLKKKLSIIPTGVDTNVFHPKSKQYARKQLGIPKDAAVIGTVSRLEAEKNLVFLTQSVSRVLKRNPNSVFLLVGEGSQKEVMLSLLREQNLSNQVIATGVLNERNLMHAYNAMDVFAFASKTETQGVVLVEAMTCGIPVVALQASGVQDVVKDGKNGRLVAKQDSSEFATALEWVLHAPDNLRHTLKKQTLDSAQMYDCRRCADRVLKLYKQEIEHMEDYLQNSLFDRCETEWNIWSNAAKASAAAFLSFS